MPEPQRRFSQNWLVNDELADALVRAIGTRPGNCFLEIGPGEGRLTAALLRRGATVTAVEVDERCCEALQQTAAAFPGRLTVIRADVLEFDPGVLGHGELRFAGNLPYAIASPILRWTAEHHQRVVDAHYMVPADVAARVLAPAGDSARGLLTVLVEWFFDRRILRRLGPGAFRPAPTIDSAFVQLTPHQPPACAAHGAHRHAVLQAAFSHRRKTLANALCLSGWPRENVDAALAAAGIEARARAEAVELQQFAGLAEALPEIHA